MPKVSVIIPVYNAEKFLRQCLDSVVKQTLREFEVICVDDGSTDHSLKILNDYRALDDRVRVFTQTNQGAAVARNLGIEKANGEYLLFLDSDDFFEKTLLEETYVAGAEVNADIVLFAAKQFNHKVKKSENMPWILKTELLPDRVFAASEIADRIFQVTTPSPWTKLFRKKFVLENRLQYQNLKNANDLSFVYTALFLAQKIRWLDRPLVNYRVNQGDSTQAKKKKYPKEFYFALKKLKQELEDRKLFDKFSNSFTQVAEENVRWNLKNIPYDIVSKEERQEIYKKLDLLEHTESQKNDITRNNDSSQPDISIVIPVYNVAPYLEECIKSVINQTHENIEIICVDDCSMDSSRDILNQYAYIDNRIKVIFKSKNEGTHLARETGCKAATGKYILFMDSDDYLDLELCAELLNRVSIDTDIFHYGMITSFFTEVTEENKKWRHAYMKPYQGFLEKERILQAAYIDKLFATSLVGKLFKRELCLLAYENISRLESSVGEDIYFFFILASLATKYEGVETAFKYHYCYGRGVSNQDGVSIEKFEKYTFMGVLAEQIKGYLVNKNLYRKFTSAYQTVSERMLVDVLRMFLTQVKAEDKETAAKLILKYWRGNEIFAETILKELNLSVMQFIERYDPIVEFVQEHNLSLEQIKVSVIIPTYNVSAYLPACIESILNQTLREIEIICVNDGSYDDTLDILLKYANKDKRISVINQRNKGLSGARNSGLVRAKGEYVYFIDSDDCLTSTALEELYTCAQKNNLDIIYFNGLVMYENEEMQKNYSDNRYYYYSHLNQKEPCSGQTLFQHLKQNKSYRVSACMQMIRTKYLKNIGLLFHEGIIYEDNIFTFISLLKANRVLKVDIPYYLRRYREDSIMTDIVQAKNIVGYLTCLRQMLFFVESELVDDQVEKEAIETIKSILRSIRTNYEKLDIKERKKLEALSPVDKFWFDLTVEPVKNSLENIIVKNIVEKNDIEKAGSSQKVDPIVLFIFRKVRGGIRCYKEHGLKYTLNRIKIKTSNLIHRK